MRSSHPRSAAVAALVATALATGLLVGSADAAEGAASADPIRIHDIQGTTRISPLNGKQVTDVEGIVTGVRTYGSRGFWIQDPDADDDAATSEGVFVFTSSVPTVAVGDAVKVTGTVGEYVPGGLTSGNQSVTQISKPTVTVVSSGNALPQAAAVNEYTVPAGYAPAGDPAADGSINGLTLEPSRYALDFYESLEGMNVKIGTSRVVGATDPYSELWVTVKGWENAAKRGGTVYGSYESQNTGRLQIQQLAPVAQQPFPVANVGDKLTGTTEGPLDFNQFGGYTLVARTLGTVKAGTLAPEKTKPQAANELAVATYNVENLDPTDPQEKFDALAKAVVENLASPDVLALEEIQDDNGAKNDGTVSAGQTLVKFTAAIAAAGGPAYQWATVDPEDKKDGGQPGGNIRQVFLYNPARVSFTERAPGDAVTATGVTSANGKAALTHSPAAWTPPTRRGPTAASRWPHEFVFKGKTVFLIANHFGSKGGDEALTSHHQPPVRKSEEQRLLQAQAVNGFVKEILAAQKNANVVVLGDINDFEFSATTKALADGGALHPAITSLPKSERYSYVYQGNAQVLDQILTSPAIKHFTYDSVHINAEFAAQNSDHDPQVLRFRP